MKDILILASTAPALYLTLFSAAAVVLWGRTPRLSAPLPEHARVLVIAVGILSLAWLTIAIGRRARRNAASIAAIAVAIIGTVYGALSATANQFRYRPEPDHRFSSEIADDQLSEPTRHAMWEQWRPSPFWLPSYIVWEMPPWLFPGTRRTMSGYMFDNESWCKPCYYAWSSTLGMLLSLPLYGVISRIRLNGRDRRGAQQTHSEATSESAPSAAPEASDA
jgi:hypothetical protein